MPKKKTGINITKTITLFLITVVIAIAAVATYFNVVYANRIFPNVTINGKDYSGLTKKQAFEKLENEIRDIYQNGFTFTYEDKIYKFHHELDQKWEPIIIESELPVKGISRLAISPDGSKLAVVVIETFK